MLSTDRLEAPQMRSLRGFGFVGVIVVNWRIISIRVCVLPVPGHRQHKNGDGQIEIYRVDREYKPPRRIPRQSEQLLVDLGLMNHRRM